MGRPVYDIHPSLQQTAQDVPRPCTHPDIITRVSAGRVPMSQRALERGAGNYDDFLQGTLDNIYGMYYLC